MNTHTNNPLLCRCEACAEWRARTFTPNPAPEVEHATRIEWVEHRVHTPCTACDECSRAAIALATATGSVEASHADGNHASRVTRTEVVR
jgi:hypothetical protein